MKVMERLYVAHNGVYEKTRYYVAESAKPRNSAKRKSPQKKKDSNRSHAIITLARALNNNFGPSAFILSLTFDDAHLNNLLQSIHDSGDYHASVLSALDKTARNFVRRLRHTGAKDLAYVIVSSDMDGDTINDARPHIHMIIMSHHIGKTNGKIQVAGKNIEDIWKEGKLVGCCCLNRGDFTPLARYLLAQVRDIPNRKSYICSRNLERIEPDEYITDRRPDQPFVVPAGTTILEWVRGGVDDEPALIQYIRYIPLSNFHTGQIPLHAVNHLGAFPNERNRREMC